MKAYGFMMLFLSFCLCVQAQSNQERAYKARIDSVLNYFKNYPDNKNALIALAKIKKNYDLETAYQIIDSLTLKPEGDMFWMYSTLALYLFTQSDLPPNYQNKIKQAFKDYTPLRGNTENHWLMYYTSLYLMGEYWENETNWFNGKNSVENKQEAEAWLLEWMHKATKQGMVEYDSPMYGTFYITPLLVLHQFTKDKRMKNRAEILLHWIFADYLIDYFDGLFAGAYSRLYEYDVFTKRNTQMSSIVKFILGDKTLFSIDNQAINLSSRLILVALCDYRLPDILQKIALEKTQRFVSKERKISADYIRFQSNFSEPIYRYTYFSENFCLGSLQQKDISVQTHPWHLSWRSHKNNEISTFFGIQPYYSAKDMASLFPNLQKYVVKDVVASKTNYDKEDKWIGYSPYEKSYQYKNNLLIINDLQSDEVNFKHYNLFFSKDIEQITEDKSGWIFAQTQDIYFVCYSLKPYSWIAEKEGKRLRCSSEKNAFIISVFEAKDFNSFDSFKQQFLQKVKVKYQEVDNQQITYKTLEGKTLRFDYKSAPIPFKKLFQSPYLKSKVNSQKLRIRFKKQSLLLDFKKISIIKKKD